MEGEAYWAVGGVVELKDAGGTEAAIAAAVVDVVEYPPVLRPTVAAHQPRTHAAAAAGVPLHCKSNTLRA